MNNMQAGFSANQEASTLNTVWLDTVGFAALATMLMYKDLWIDNGAVSMNVKGFVDTDRH